MKLRGEPCSPTMETYPEELDPQYALILAVRRTPQNDAPEAVPLSQDRLRGSGHQRSIPRDWEIREYQLR